MIFLKKMTSFFSILFAIFLNFEYCEAQQIVAPIAIDLECSEYIKNLPSDYTYGWISVKEDPLSKDISKDLSIFYYHNYKNGKVPVVFFNGGPLGSSHGLIPAFSRYSESRNLGMIYFDQRGTGCSSRIDMNKETPYLLLTAAKYGSFEIAYDAEEIRKKVVGDQPWKLFGQSFGVGIANRYLTLFPQYVSSVHSYAGQHFDSFAEFYAGRLKAQYDVMQAHEYVYPGTIERIRKAKAQLDPKVCIEVDGSKVCGTVLIDAMFVSLSGLPHLTKPIIDKVIDEKGVPNLEAIQTEFKYTLDLFFSKTWYVAAALMRNEFDSIDTLMHLSKDCDLAYKNLEAQTRIKKKDLVIDECNVVSYTSQVKDFYGTFKEQFPKIPFHTGVKSNDIYRVLEKHPHIQYFASSSGMDPFSGYYPILNFAKGSKQIIYRHYSWLGHGGYKFTPEFWDDIALEQ